MAEQLSLNRIIWLFIFLQSEGKVGVPPREQLGAWGSARSPHPHLLVGSKTGWKPWGS